MKKILICAALFLAMGCNKDEGDPNPGVPSITRIRTEAGTVTYAKRGMSVEIDGKNLIKVNSVTFNGCEADLSVAVIAQQRILLAIPDDAPTIADGPVTDEVVVSTDGGEARSKLILLPPEPVLTSLSNTMPEVGETIVIGGENLFYVQEVQFPGRRIFTVTDFTVSEEGSQIEVTVPEGYDPSKGDIRVVTLSGEAAITPDVPEEPEEPLPDEPLTVTELKYLPDVSYASWEVKENLQEGDLVYVDRTTMTFSSIPEFYKGSLWISTAVDSRGYINEAEPLVSFRVNRTCDVYIAYNKGTVGWVKWLQDGTWTRMEIDADKELHEEIKVVSTQFPDGEPDTYYLYKRRFEAGVIELRANSNQKNTRSPYFVILK